MDAFRAHLPERLPEVEQAVMKGKTPPTAAARMLLKDFLKS